MKINIFWFRRDLRLSDNTGLDNALHAGLPVMPLFIFDTGITDELTDDDARITFIFDKLEKINNELRMAGSSVKVLKGEPAEIWKNLIRSYEINAVYVNRDYEPSSIERDKSVSDFLKKNDIAFQSYKDQVIFEGPEVLKPDNKPYTVFTPYKKSWLRKYSAAAVQRTNTQKDHGNGSYLRSTFNFPSPCELGFRKSKTIIRPYDLSAIKNYHNCRDLPAEDRTTYLSPHLRFGTVSIREIAKIAAEENQVFLNELIWREFFMQILFHFPHVVTGNFNRRYDDIQWRNNEKEFEMWCKGETGYPIVDAGMRQLNETGYMHNRVRMITAGFLCKHLLTDWRWGEAYFANKLLDYELSSNNGNWQWSAGTGCDAAPWFRIFNPVTQQKKFDPGNRYIAMWSGDENLKTVRPLIVDHNFARQRAVSAYRAALNRQT